MAWNPSPKVAAARDYGKKFGFDQVVVIGINNRRNIMASASYGVTKKSCDEARILADAAYDAVFEKIDSIR
jgi:hypothetical protein